ncbi:CocE/NonD family hydrolase [Mycobacterium sp. NPDC003323]
MGAACFIGRVGGLAVALGVGVAVFSGAGAAFAETDGTGVSAGSSADAAPNPAPKTESAAPDETDGEQTSPRRLSTAKSLRDNDSEDDELRDSTPRTSVTGRDRSAASSPDEFADQDVETTEADTTDIQDDEGTHAVPVSSPEPEVSAADTAPLPEIESDPAPAATRPETTAGETLPIDAMGEWALLGSARREAVDSADGYAPDIAVHDGVITGTNATPDPKNSYAVIGRPVTHGKVTFDSATGNFTFLPNSTQLQPWGYDQFRVLTMQKSGFVQFLETIPVLKYFVQPIVVRLHQIPILGTLLTPIIGNAQRTDVRIEVADYIGADPIAFTTEVTSFDGTRISVNYFPMIGLATGDTAPTILNGPSLATRGYTDPTQETTVLGLVPGLAKLRPDYNVVTWDPRGEFASTGRMHLDSELFEARDVAAIISWVAQQAGTAFDPGTTGRLNPLVGMVGGSYGGGIQLSSAGIDSRIDAIVPGIAWNSLTGALYPENAFKTSWASLLLLALVVQESRLDPEIYTGIITGALTGFLTGHQQDFLHRNSPATVVGNITAPTLFMQGTVDTLFPLQQAMANAAALADGVPVKMIWYCGGHGTCLDPGDTAGQSAFLLSETMQWLDTYVMNKTAGTPPPVDGPKFTWVDQLGNWYASEDLPIDPGFEQPDPISVSDGGGYLAIAPFLGGSGPQNQWAFPLGYTLAAPARHALNTAIPDPAETTYIVGAPTLTMTYSGLGTSRHVFAQIVDRSTDRVVGNIASPIPVRLDGGRHTVTVDMEAIAYTLNPGDDLVLQIVDSATSFANGTAYGLIHISDVTLDLPVAADVIPLMMGSGVGALQPAVGA